MTDQFLRSEMLFGAAAMKKLKDASVAVFGVGGVGGYAVEALARAGIGHLTLFDNDTIAQSNINRQIIALHSTVGLLKVEVMAARVRDINPAAGVTAVPVFYTVENAMEYDLGQYDYIVDAIDTISAKIELIVRADAAGTPIVSAMGCGNKLDATAFCVADLYKTDTDPIARVLRRELRRRNIKKLKVVYSTEKARTPQESKETKGTAGRPAPGSLSYVPGVAGLILAGEVIQDIAVRAAK